MTRRRRHPSLVPLSHDHRDALALAFRLHHPAPPGPVTSMTPASTPRSRADDTIAFFADHLAAHFRAEEEALFRFLRPLLVDHAESLALIDSLVADHRELEARRDAVAAAKSEEVLVATLTAFADLLETHVRREERELFEHFPDGVPPADAQALGDAIRRLLGR
jgi:hemerythrin-like domain-containing protein